MPLIVRINLSDEVSSQSDDSSLPGEKWHKQCNSKKKVKSPKRRKKKGQFARSMLSESLLREDKGIVCLSIDVETAGTTPVGTKWSTPTCGICHGVKFGGIPTVVRKCNEKKVQIRSGKMNCIRCPDRVKNLMAESENAQIKQMTSNGCHGCDAVICKLCWRSYEHNMGKNSK
jgi:hypothetical protein